MSPGRDLHIVLKHALCGLLGKDSGFYVEVLQLQSGSSGGNFGSLCFLFFLEVLKTQ